MILHAINAIKEEEINKQSKKWKKNVSEEDKKIYKKVVKMFWQRKRKCTQTKTKKRP